MASPFDALAATAFGVISNALGEPASWGGLTGQVLYQEPSTEQRIGNVDYAPLEPSCEYKAEIFPGLKAAVDAGATLEEITIGTTVYYVRKVEAIQDGKACKATLKRKP